MHFGLQFSLPMPTPLLTTTTLALAFLLLNDNFLPTLAPSSHIVVMRGTVSNSKVHPISAKKVAEIENAEELNFRKNAGCEGPKQIEYFRRIGGKCPPYLKITKGSGGCQVRGNPVVKVHQLMFDKDGLLARWFGIGKKQPVFLLQDNVKTTDALNSLVALSNPSAAQHCSQQLTEHRLLVKHETPCRLTKRISRKEFICTLTTTTAKKAAEKGGKTTAAAATKTLHLEIVPEAGFGYFCGLKLKKSDAKKDDWLQAFMLPNVDSQLFILLDSQVHRIEMPVKAVCSNRKDGFDYIVDNRCDYADFDCSLEVLTKVGKIEDGTTIARTESKTKHA